MKRWVVAATLAIAGWAAPTASAELVYGVTDSSKLVTFDTGSPGTIISTVAITGLDTEEVIKGIDVRPATLQLFALGSTGQLYRIDAVSGEARAIGTPIPITIQPTTNIDVDFDPTIDRLRVVSDAEQNFIVSPNSGAVQGQTALSPAGDVTGLAHTNNGPASATYPLAPATQAYDIDTGTNLLKVHSTPPSSGTLTTVGALNVDLIGDVGFDISTASTADGSLGANAAFAVGRTADGNDRLYTVNLGSGGATEVGEIAGADRVRDIAIVPPIPQLAVLTTSQLPIEGQQLRTVRADRPGTASPAVDITGLQGGDTLIGIDRRPLDGALIGVSDGRRIYSINPATGAATQIGNTQFPALNGFAFGMDFNPVTDRIRLVSDEDENRRLNPTDGTQTATDTNLVYPPGDPFQGTNPDVTAIAHTHPFSGAASTLLFGIDTNIDTLVTIDPPDSGTVHTITGGLNVDATDENGFDIARRFNHMFAALQTSSTGGSTLFAVAVGGAAGPPVTAANANAVVIGALGLGTGRFAQGLAIVNDNVLAAAPTPEPSPTPSPTPTVTPTITPTVTPTITPTPTPKPRKRKPGLTGKVRPRRDAGAPFRFRVTGALRRPSGVSKKAGCKGRIQIRVRKGAKALARRTVRVRKTCRYSARLVLGRKAGPKGKASFRISFRGNARLKTRTITRAARYGPV